MNHSDLFKRAFSISWRYRPLWLFGFLLALCSGGSGGGGGGNYSSPSGNFDNGDYSMPSTMPDVDPALIIAIIGGLICLALLFAIVGVVIRAVSRTAIMGMVEQITHTETVTIRNGWRLGWSSGAWRLFLVGLVIGIPVAIIAIFLLTLAFLPLLLAFAGDTGVMMVSIAITVLALLLVVLVLLIIGVIISPILELSWRYAVLGSQGVFDSIGNSFGLIKRNIKDVAIVWLLMVGVGLLWAIIAFIVVLPVSLIVALLLGGLPAGLIYFATSSIIGAAVAGIPLAVLALVVVMSFATGLYLVFQSSVWTLAYLELMKSEMEPPNISAPAETPQEI